jgi:molybdate transport system ATP-binding protein
MPNLASSALISGKQHHGAAMIEVDLKATRCSFHLEIECAFSAPWTVVFGPSGAGKTTLLRLIAGLDSPDSGRIAIGGHYVTDTAVGLQTKLGKRLTTMVTQQPALFPHLTVEENIAFGIAALAPEARHHRVAEMIELADASHLAPRYPRDLSGGEAQRVALARALAPKPRLLLLDEPFSALDGPARDELLIGLKGWLLEQGIQTIIVTHDPLDALATEAEVALLRDGKLASLGPANTVLAAERQRLLARLGH